jgi:hypothetical protein
MGDEIGSLVVHVRQEICAYPAWPLVFYLVSFLISHFFLQIFVHGVVNGNYNAPFFMSRFQGAMDHYSTLFEGFGALLPAEHPNRAIIEQEFHGRAILNILACEGLERVERAEPYTSWQARSLRAGFTQMPISESTKAKIRSLLRHYPTGFAIGEDNGWLLAGWNGKIVYALCAYKPTSRMTSRKQPP